MNSYIKNILAGLGAFPLILVTIMGIGIASGLKSEFLLLPIIITNLIHIFSKSKSFHFFSISAGLTVFYASMMYEEKILLDQVNLATLVMLAIPALLFIIFSLVKTSYNFIPVNVVGAITLGIGVVVILKQLPMAIGYDPSIPHDDDVFNNLSGTNWLQFMLTLSIPIAGIIGEKYLKEYPVLLATFIINVVLAYLIPLNTELIDLKPLVLESAFNFDWRISPSELTSAMVYGISLFIISICIFMGNYEVLTFFNVSMKDEVRKNLRILGISSMISAFFSVVPVNVNLVKSIAIVGNKATNRISILTIVILLSVVAFVKIPDLYFPLQAVAGLMFFIGYKLIAQTFNHILKGKGAVYISLAIIGALVVIFSDFLKGFVFSMITGLIFEFILMKKTKGKSNEIED